MRLPTTLLLTAATALALAACSSTSDQDVETPGDTPLLTDPLPLPPDSAESERFVIRDKQQRLRVDGRTSAGRMTGMWVYYDSRGEKLATVNYRHDQRSGPAQLFYVTADGPAVGRLRMNGAYAGGAQNGMFESRWPSGGKKSERDFDQGILQGARGWSEKGTRLSDGAAMTQAIAESKDEEALLTELENFVQLQMRKRAATKSESQVPDVDLEVPRTDPSTPAPYPGGTAPLAPP
jgi:hypothetical protein